VSVGFIATKGSQPPDFGCTFTRTFTFEGFRLPEAIQTPPVGHRTRTKRRLAVADRPVHHRQERVGAGHQQHLVARATVGRVQNLFKWYFRRCETNGHFFSSYLLEKLALNAYCLCMEPVLTSIQRVLRTNSPFCNNSVVIAASFKMSKNCDLELYLKSTKNLVWNMHLLENLRRGRVRIGWRKRIPMGHNVTTLVKHETFHAVEWKNHNSVINFFWIFSQHTQNWNKLTTPRWLLCINKSAEFPS